MDHDGDIVFRDLLEKRHHDIGIDGDVGVRTQQRNAMEPQDLDRSFQFIHGRGSLVDRHMGTRDELSGVIALNLGIAVVDGLARLEAVGTPRALVDKDLSIPESAMYFRVLSASCIQA